DYLLGTRSLQSNLPRRRFDVRRVRARKLPDTTLVTDQAGYDIIHIISALASLRNGGRGVHFEKSLETAMRAGRLRDLCIAAGTRLVIIQSPFGTPPLLLGVTVLKKILCTLRKLDRFPMRYFLLYNQTGSGAIALTALPVSWH